MNNKGALRAEIIHSSVKRSFRLSYSLFIFFADTEIILKNILKGCYLISRILKLIKDNKKSGKKSQKRCYQGADAIDDLQDALDGKNSKLSDVLRKIDK